MPTADDLYGTLGVSTSATADEIKRAYRRLARQLHPDVNPDAAAQQRFRQVISAYETLSDPHRRQTYDGSRRRSAPAAAAVPKGADIHVQLAMKLEQIARGGTQRITLEDGRQMTFKLPAGLRPGQTVKLAGRGQAAPRGGVPGDMLLELHADPDPRFEVHDGVVHSNITVPVWDAVLGGEVTVTTVHGPVVARVPAGSQPGRTLRLTGRGFGDADHIAHLRLHVPAQLTPEQLKAWAHVAQAHRAT